jgi:hypothetical protein
MRTEDLEKDILDIINSEGITEVYYGLTNLFQAKAIARRNGLDIETTFWDDEKKLIKGYRFKKRGGK